MVQKLEAGGRGLGDRNVTAYSLTTNNSCLLCFGREGLLLSLHIVGIWEVPPWAINTLDFLFRTLIKVD